MNPVWYFAFVRIVDYLSLEAAARSTHAGCGAVHGLLKGIAFPAKNVVLSTALIRSQKARCPIAYSVLSVTSIVASAKDEGLRTIGRPVGFVIKLRGVPDDLHQC